MGSPKWSTLISTQRRHEIVEIAYERINTFLTSIFLSLSLSPEPPFFTFVLFVQTVISSYHFNLFLMCIEFSAALLMCYLLLSRTSYVYGICLDYQLEVKWHFPLRAIIQILAHYCSCRYYCLRLCIKNRIDFQRRLRARSDFRCFIFVFNYMRRYAMKRPFSYVLNYNSIDIFLGYCCCCITKTE